MILTVIRFSINVLHVDTTLHKVCILVYVVLPVICAVILFLVMRIYQNSEKALIIRTLDDTAEMTASRMRSDRKYREDIISGKLADREFFDDAVQLMI